MSKEEILRRRETWLIKPDKAARQLKFFTQPKNSVKGEIVSWKYLEELDCIAVRRSVGVQYFKRVQDLRSLPYWDVRSLVKKKLLGAERNGYIRHFVDQLTYEANTKWKNYRPQFPERIVKSNELKENGLPKVILKYKAPRVIKRIPFMPMEQNVCHNMRCWCYFPTTGEAVIVLSENGKWRTIKILDPIWLVNMSKSDIEALFLNKLNYRPEDFDLAKPFIDMVEMCYAYEVNAGSKWTTKWKEFGFEAPQQM